MNVRLNSLNGVPDDSTYNGPAFDNLSESLQDAFVNYLEDRKINSDLCHFIISYSQDKEQREYVHWLTNLVKFTSA